MGCDPFAEPSCDHLPDSFCLSCDGGEGFHFGRRLPPRGPAPKRSALPAHVAAGLLATSSLQHIEKIIDRPNRRPHHRSGDAATIATTVLTIAAPILQTGAPLSPHAKLPGGSSRQAGRPLNSLSTHAACISCPARRNPQRSPTASFLRRDRTTSWPRKPQRPCALPATSCRPLIARCPSTTSGTTTLTIPSTARKLDQQFTPSRAGTWLNTTTDFTGHDPDTQRLVAKVFPRALDTTGANAAQPK
jgi:hypothetical protein